MTARNPSTRPIYLLDNLWIAYGIEISSPDRKDWLEAMEKEINGNHQIMGGAHSIVPAIRFPSLPGMSSLTPASNPTRRSCGPLSFTCHAAPMTTSRSMWDCPL